MKTAYLLLIVIVANAAGNIVLGYGMHQVGDIASYSPLAMIQGGMRAFTNPWVTAGVILLLIFFVAHALVLSRADLSYVLLVTSIGYVLVAVLGWLVLGETISTGRWAGTVLITFGVGVVGSTPASTTDRPRGGAA